MRWISENKGSAAALVLMAVALVILAVFLFQGMGSDAEAVLGGQGNLGTAGANHPHNLSAGSNYARAVDEDQICIFCHTPHFARVKEEGGKPIINAPLWNHELSDVDYTVKVTYTTVPASNSSIINAIPLLSSPPVRPDGASRLCLSCHDGEVSIGAVYYRTGFLNTANDIDMVDACMGTSGSETAGLDGSDKMTNACRAYIGRDLTSKHVVSIPMNDDLISASIANCPPSGSASMYLRYPWVGGQEGTVLLRPTAEQFNSNYGVTRTTGKYKSGYNYGVQCSTCHDPHRWKLDDADGIREAEERMLVLDFNTLCFTCHVNCT